MSQVEYQYLLGKSRDAKRGGRDAWSVQSTILQAAIWTGCSGFRSTAPIGEEPSLSYEYPCNTRNEAARAKGQPT